MHFKEKNTLTNNHYHSTKQALNFKEHGNLIESWKRYKILLYYLAK
jgi:hypothetical protein